MYFDRIIPLMNMKMIWGYKLIGFHYLGYGLDICPTRLDDTNTLVSLSPLIHAFIFGSHFPDGDQALCKGEETES